MPPQRQKHPGEETHALAHFHPAAMMAEVAPRKPAPPLAASMAPDGTEMRLMRLAVRWLAASRRLHAARASPPPDAL